jgi:Flp pilus assembly protein TadG
MSRLDRKPRRRFPSCQGQASIELILVLPILLLLIFGGLDFARAVAVHDALNNGTGIATRALTLDPAQWPWAEMTVRTEVSNNVFGTAGIGAVSVTATGPTGNVLAPSQLAGLVFGTNFCLEGATTFTPAVPFLANQAVTIRSRHCGIVERMP